MLRRRNGSEPPSSSTTFLRLRPAISATAAARSLRARQRHAAQARVGDHRLDLLVGGVDVDVRVRREAGLLEDLLHRRRRLGALRRVLEQDRVADHQVRAGEARHLVVGVVPRHDAEQHAHRAAAHEGRALSVGELDRLVREQRLRVVGVERVDVDAEVDLAHGLLDRLAHLADDDLAEPLALLAVDLAHAPQKPGALLHRRRTCPLAMSGVRPPDRRVQLVVADRRIGLDRLAGGRIYDRVITHSHSLAGSGQGYRGGLPPRLSQAKVTRVACQLG